MGGADSDLPWNYASNQPKEECTSTTNPWGRGGTWSVPSGSSRFPSMIVS